MAVFRIVLMVLAILHLLFTALTAVVGQFADGSDVASRLVLSALHPLAAIGILLLVFIRRLPSPIVVGVAVILVVNIVADATLAVLIATRAMKGDWPLAVVFAVVPTIALIYGAIRLRSLPSPEDDITSEPISPVG